MTDKRNNKACFVIAPIGRAGSEVRLKSNQVLRHIIKPCTKALGFSAVRADEMQKPGMITMQVIRKVIDAPLVVADLSGHNPNVFYELAVRHAQQKPVVHMIDSNELIPFDVAQFRTIEYDLSDPDSVADCKAQLTRQIQEVLKDPTIVDNPIANTILIQQLQVSTNPIEVAGAKLMNGIEDLEEIIRILDLRLRHTGARGQLLDELVLSFDRLRTLIEVSLPLNEEDADTIRTALDLHVMSVAQLLRDMGINDQGRLLALR